MKILNESFSAIIKIYILFLHIISLNSIIRIDNISHGYKQFKNTIKKEEPIFFHIHYGCFVKVILMKIHFTPNKNKDVRKSNKNQRLFRVTQCRLYVLLKFGPWTNHANIVTTCIGNWDLSYFTYWWIENYHSKF